MGQLHVAVFCQDSSVFSQGIVSILSVCPFTEAVHIAAMKGASLLLCQPLLPVGVLCLFVLLVGAQFPAQFVLPGPAGSPVSAHVDGQGRVFVAAGRQLLRLNRDLVPQQNVSLSSDAVRISLGSGGERLVVCTLDGSCDVYRTSDLSAGPSSSFPSALPGALAANPVLFTSENSFYVGSHDQTPSDIDSGTIRLAQFGGLQGSSNFVRSMNYPVLNPQGFLRIFFGGFVSGGNAYYLATDLEPTPNNDIGVKVMRVCDNGCNGPATCDFDALYEETIGCGGSFGRTNDGVCGVSLVEDFAGTEGPSMLVSRCRPRRTDSNLVCLLPLVDIDVAMETRFNDCRAVPSSRSELIWNNRISCSDLQVRYCKSLFCLAMRYFSSYQTCVRFWSGQVQLQRHLVSVTSLVLRVVLSHHKQ